MSIDLHNWETLDELVRAEYDARHLEDQVSWEVREGQLGPMLCGVAYYRTKRVWSFPYKPKHSKKLSLLCAARLVRDHVRPMV